MGVIVVVCAVLGLTVSEAKTKIMCLRASEDAEVHRHIQRRGSGPGVQPDERLCMPRGKRQSQCRPIHRGRPGHTQHMVQLPEVHPRNVRPTERFPRAQNPDAKSREVLETMLYGCVTWSPPACHYDTLRRVHHRFLIRCIGWRKHNRADHPIFYLDRLIKTGSESIEVTLRWRRILFAGFVARMEDTRLPKSARCSEKRWGTRAVSGARKIVDGVFPGRPQSFRHQRRPVDDCSPGQGGKAQNGRTRGGTFHGEMDRCRESQGWTTDAVACPNATGRIKERIAQSKRDRAGSLTLVD